MRMICKLVKKLQLVDFSLLYFCNFANGRIQWKNDWLKFWPVKRE